MGTSYSSDKRRAEKREGDIGQRLRAGNAVKESGFISNDKYHTSYVFLSLLAPSVVVFHWAIT